MKKRLLLLLAIALPAMLPFAVQAQNTFALKTNALYWATATPNLGAELAFKDKHSVQLFYGYNPWRFSERASLRHWVLQPEYRYWFCQGLNGWFVGVHLMGGEFNLGEIDLPLGIWDDLSERRYEGHYYGGGVTVGYQVPISRHWGFEASIGVGYDHIVYDKYACGVCGERLGSGRTNYFGPTKASLSFLYVF